ncbi:oligomeric golgi complex component, COG2-domain-containing protein [Spinellus fusiger]|nr:oligomeric golgi complex component, COG2-domain-containing protein [Spinellus fusiger]
MNRTHNRRPSVKRPVFSFGDDEQDDDTIINSVEPLPSQAIERTAFTAHDFNLDRFLSSRRHLGLESLKIELNSHLKLLKTELIELLNRDYQDFVNLSTNLKGVDRAMEDLMKPLTHMETQVKCLFSACHGVARRTVGSTCSCTREKGPSQADS